MTEHIFDDIPRLLTGDADRVAVQNAAVHLRGCEDCTEELVSAVVAHASLTSAARFAPEIIKGIGSVPGQASEAPLPDLSSVFDRVHDEATSHTPIAVARRARHARSSRRTQWIAAAAVVALGAGGATVYATDHGSSSDSRTVAIAAFDQGTVSAKATLSKGTNVRVDASALPKLDNSRYYEVWLTDGAGISKAPVGQLNGQGEGTFVVPPSTIDSYSAIQVSIQETDGTGTFSGTSVLRGTYR